MNKLKRILLTFFCIMLVLGPTEAWCQPKPNKVEPPKVIKNVVVVTIVGPQISQFNSHNTPTIYGLGKEGIDAEGLIHPALTSSDEVIAASLRTGAQGNLAAIYRSMPRKTLLLNLQTNTISSTKQFNFTTQSLNEFYKLFQQEKPFLSYLSLEVGKGGINSLADADSLLARFVGQLHNLGLYDNSMVIVLGLQKGPQGVNVGDAVIKGVNLKNGYSSPTYQLADVAPTLLFVTDGKLVKGGQGQVLWPLLKVDSLQLENNLLQKRIAELSARQSDLLKEKYGFEQTRVSMSQEQQRLSQEKAAIHSEINKRDRRIAALELQRNSIVVSFGLVILLMLLGYVIEYWVLKKRFLMF